MTALIAWVNARNKALGTAALGAYNWGWYVVLQKHPITAPEWMLLAGVGLAALGVHQVTNGPGPSTPPPPVAMTVVPSMTYTTSAGPAQAPQVTGGTTPEIPPAA